MELVGMPDKQHGTLSVGMDTEDGSKKLKRTFQHFYRYILQVSHLSRVANRGWKPDKQHRGVGCSPDISICCQGWSACGLRTAATAGDMAGDIQSRGTAWMCFEEQILKALHRAEPVCPDRCPAEPWMQPRSFPLGNLVGQASAN